MLTLLAALFLPALATPAAAHAQLLETTPQDGEQLDEAPGEVTATFNEPVSAEIGAMRVYNSTGEQVDLGDAGTGEAPEQVRVSLPELGHGVYVATWRVISADGHPVQGAFMFSVGAAGAVDDDLLAALMDPTGDRVWQILATGNRWIGYAAVLLAAGAMLFGVLVHDRRQDERALLTRTVQAASVVTVATSVLTIGFQAALLSGLGAAALVSGEALTAVATSNVGWSAFLRAGAAALLIVAAVKPWTSAGTVVGVFGAVAALASFAVTGHTVTSDPRWLAAAANVTHTLFAAAWFGGLVMLWRVLGHRRTGNEDAVSSGMLVRRFSGYALLTVVLVTIAGTALAWAEVRAFRALFSTAYGVTLIIKVAAVGVVVALAAYNRQKLVPAIQAAGDAATGTAKQAWRSLTNVLRAEIVGILLVLLVTGVLVNLTPARTEAGIVGVYSAYTDVGDTHEMNVTVDPNRAGRNLVHFYLFSETGQVTDADSISVSFTQTDVDLGPLEREPDKVGPGHWILTGDELSMPGPWMIEATVLLEDLSQETGAIEVYVGG